MAKTFLPPGFRFHPTDIELVWYYLKRKIMGKPFRFEAISEVELYKFAPWDLPDKSCLRSKDLEWYFFCPRDRKYSQGSRTNRATDIGYWKTTGKDRSIVHNTRTVGMKKTLIFHLGKAPQGSRTDWVMYEFRLKSEELVNARSTQDSYVICKIFQKSGPGPRNGEQYGAPFKEEDWEDDADIEDAGSFPSTSATEHAHFFENVPQQAVVAPEVGVTSSLLSNFEVGEPSSVLSNVEVREPFSVISNVKVGEPSSVLSNVEVGEPSSVLSNVEVREPFSVISNVEVGEPSSVLSNVEVGEPSSVLSNVQVREPFSVICNVEVGEPSSVLSNVEVGEPSSCVPELSAIGELSSMQGFPDVDEPSHVPEPFFADGILLDQLEAVLNSSPTHPESANDEMFNSAILHDDDTPVPGVDFENIYDLIDLSSQPLPEPTEGTALCDSVGFDDELHPLLTEFANEHYVELSDIGFVGEWNPFLAPVDYHYPPANDGSYGLGNIYPDNALDPYIVSESELTGFADDQFPSTFEDHHLT